MIRWFMIVCAALMLLTGCSDSSLERPGGRTQEIVQEESSAAPASSSDRLEVPDYMGTESAVSESSAPDVPAVPSSSQADASSAHPSSQTEESSGAGTPPASSGTADTENLYAVRAEQEAIEIDIHILESNYRIGQMDEASFQQEKERLIQEKRNYDTLEDCLERSQVYTFTLPETTDGKIQRLREIESELDALEQEMDQTEDEYFRGLCTREEFIQTRTAQEQREDVLDEEEERLEDYLDDWD